MDETTGALVERADSPAEADAFATALARLLLDTALRDMPAGGRR